MCAACFRSTAGLASSYRNPDLLQEADEIDGGDGVSTNESGIAVDEERFGPKEGLSAIRSSY